MSKEDKTKNTKIVIFTDLVAWKESHKLVLQVYKTVNKFPNKEKYALSDQMRRAIMSVSSNIAEGFTRQGIKEKIQFYLMANASLTEIQNQLIIARDVKYISVKESEILLNQSVLVHKLISGLIKGIKKYSHKT